MRAVKAVAQIPALLVGAALGAAAGFVVGTTTAFAVLEATGRGCEPVDYTGGPCPNAVGSFAFVAGGLPAALSGGIAGAVAAVAVLERRASRAADGGAAGR
jgi:hypothetical protein